MSGNVMLSEIIGTLQEIHGRFGDMPFRILSEADGTLALFPFGGLMVSEYRGGRNDGQDYMVFYPETLSEKVQAHCAAAAAAKEGKKS